MVFTLLLFRRLPSNTEGQSQLLTLSKHAVSKVSASTEQLAAYVKMPAILCYFSCSSTVGVAAGLTTAECLIQIGLQRVNSNYSACYSFGCLVICG